MNWLRRIWNRWRYRPTLQNFWSPEIGQKIIPMVPWRDLIVVATECDVCHHGRASSFMGSGGANDRAPAVQQVEEES